MKFCGPCVAGRCIPPRQGITPAEGPPGCGGIIPGGIIPGGRDPGPVVIIPGAPVAGNPARRPNMFCGGIIGVGCICVVIMVFNPRRNVHVSKFAALPLCVARPALRR